MTEFEMEAIWRKTCPDEHFCSQYFDFAAALIFTLDNLTLSRPKPIFA